MFKLQSTIGSFGNVFVGIGIQVNARFEALRSLCASSYRALPRYASLASDHLWQGVIMPWSKPRLITARCLTTVKRRQRRHDDLCHRAVV